MHPAPPGIRSFATALPETFLPLESLPVHSPPEVLREWGFEGSWIGSDAGELGYLAAAGVLEKAEVDPGEVDALLWTSALSVNHEQSGPECPGSGLLQHFCYSASRLQYRLSLTNAAVCGIAQQGCAGLFAALRQARALMLAEPEVRHVLCVAADVLPAGSEREVLYNVISDAACACLVSRDRVAYRWLGLEQISKGYYWNVPERQAEIIAAYFPTAALTVRRLLQKCGLDPAAVDLVIPTGVNRSSWPILMRMCGIGEARLFEPAQRFGHTIAADSLLMLEQAERQSRIRPGMKVLLFAYGFGSSWTALLLEAS